jgi:hypothetical protein
MSWLKMINTLIKTWLLSNCHQIACLGNMRKTKAMQQLALPQQRFQKSSCFAFKQYKPLPTQSVSM